MTEKKCEERIDAELKDRIQDFKNALKGKFDDGCEYEDFIEWINSCSLAFENDPHYRAKKLELSWGGPADFFLFFEDGTIEYHFQDWFDGDKRMLRGKDYKIMKEVYDHLI